MNRNLRNQTKILAAMNHIMMDMIAELPNKPQLGPQFNSHEFEPIWLTSHRIKKTFFVSGSIDKEALHRAAISETLVGDSKLTGFRYDHPKLRFVKRALYQGRLELDKILTDFTLDYSSFDISSGETYVSSGGRTSLFQKLKSKEQWTVTADAAPYVVKLLYSNRGLKKAAMMHIRSSTTRFYRHSLWKTCVGINHRNRGFRCFESLCFSHLFTIVNGSRIESVPKNNEKRRTINVEPWLNVILQRVISHSLRKCLKEFGNDLETGQFAHQRLISNRKLATIDFANASNSTALSSVNFMFPRRISTLLKAARSPFTYNKTDDSEYQLNMLSAMGNGFTFEVMTLLLLAVGRVMDPCCRVYGDDVIIRNRVARHYVDCCEVLGYEVNAEKTFINSSFRESCGAFYHDDHGYLDSFKFEPKDNMTIIDLVIWTNKLYILRNQHTSIARAYERALKLFPPSMKGPAPHPDFNSADFLSNWVWSLESKHRYDTNVDNTHPNPLIQKISEILTDWHYGDSMFRIISSYRLSPVLASKTLVEVKGFKALSYLYSGRRVSDVVRNKHTVNPCKWVIGSNFCFPLSAMIRD